MSFWYEPTKENMSIEDDELHVLLGHDDSGNIWVSMKIADIKEITNL